MSVEVHDEHFDEKCDDVDWLPQVGAKGWIVLTKDKHIRRRPLERHALEAAKVGAFVLTAGIVTGPEMAEAFVKALPRMRAIVASHARPFIAAVHKGGTVAVIVGERRGGIKRDP